MLIRSELVSDSIRRAQRSRANPADLAKSVGATERKRKATPEQRQQRWSAVLAQTGNATTAHTMLERLLGGNDLVGINYLELGTCCARSVCRIRLRDAGGATVGFGTGFLVAPGVLMTNHHVLSSADQARLAQAEFDYELDVRGNDKRVARFAILDSPAPIPFKELDFCLAAVSVREDDSGRALDEFGWLPLNGTPGKAVVGEYLTIIQHPGGERKQVCVRENKLLKFDEGGNTVWYMTDTVAGSSGSPVFNQSWQVVALHHSGIPKTDSQGRWLTVDGKPWDPSMDESRVAWIANEGMRISRILEYLRSTHAEDPLAKAVLQHANTPNVTPLTPEKAPSTTTPEIRDGQLRLTIPVQVALSLGGLGLPGPALPRAPAIDQRAVAANGAVSLPAAIEAVVVDQSNYAERPGYDPDFLGGGKLRVPLPTARTNQVLAAGRGKPELRYWNYSVLMHKTRRLAIFSAVNVDARKRPPGAGRDGDRWYTDSRIDAKDQLGAEFYGAQREFEVDRSATPFDRGHLTRRLDAQWGDGDDATRNGNDSFHWTNCSPQHWKFNQGAKRWLGLEDYVVQGFAGKRGRACIINGPIFDAPLSSKGADGAPVLAPDGKRHPDPTFGDVSIPKQFFKVVACVSGPGELAVAAFVMSQEDLLAQTDRIRGMPPLREEEKLTEAEARLYQVPVATVAKLTGLDFGALADADTSDAQEAMTVPRPIERLEDVHLETRRTPRLVKPLRTVET